jgi:riboflavin kinase/FMN adenylyltransferase
VHGDHRGRLLGFPTANLQTPAGVLVPKLGIYAGATLGHTAAISIGTNPTYGGTERRAEAHLLDFDADLYGQRLVVELWERLRDEVRFASEQDLVEAIAADCLRARVSVRPP